MSIGKSIPRVDAYDKVTGRAMYTEDLIPQGALTAKVIRSTIANGRVKKFALDEALKVPGVIKILTCFDVPDFAFPTAGHPWSTQPSHQDICDRLLLNTRIRVYGDDIAVVVAENEIACKRAARLVQVEYEEYPALVRPEQAMEKGASCLHEAYPDNILKQTKSTSGDVCFEEACKEDGLIRLYQTYHSQTVQHCHIENPVSYAYMEKGRVVVVSSTQIPHIIRRIVGQALGMPWGNIRIIKPYIGGGFGNKQDSLYEPLNAWLTTQLGGRAVKLELSREETMACTRVRHAIDFELDTAVRKDGTLVARRLNACSNQGGYASHGHAIVANTVNAYRMMYQSEKALEISARTVYTNLTVGGAMRAYGIPQAAFAYESHMDDLALALKIDPIEFRLKNCMPEGFVDPDTGITCHSSGLRECIEKGRNHIGWDAKRQSCQNQTGMVRKGVGMSIFCYKTGVYPISLETSSCRMTLNQDGSVQLQLGATEIGQGADTVFSQMAAQSIGVLQEKVHITSTQDTDVTPFDTGAYASRQSYVAGMAVKQTGQILKDKILDFAGNMLHLDAGALDIKDGMLIHLRKKEPVCSLGDVAMEALYSLKNSTHISAESTHQCQDNTFAFGACFVEIEVDIPVGKIKILDIINVHDSGVLLNPKLAEAQVHGGMSMGLGYGLSEQILYDDKARPLNDNLLDYKLPTSMDTPELHVEFAHTVDPTGPFGNKALGEPPAVPLAPAVRNALLHATGVGINSIPLTPQKLVEHFKENGLIPRGGKLYV